MTLVDIFILTLHPPMKYKQTGYIIDICAAYEHGELYWPPIGYRSVVHPVCHDYTGVTMSHMLVWHRKWGSICPHVTTAHTCWIFVQFTEAADQEIHYQWYHVNHNLRTQVHIVLLIAWVVCYSWDWLHTPGSLLIIVFIRQLPLMDTLPHWSNFRVFIIMIKLAHTCGSRTTLMLVQEPHIIMERMTLLVNLVFVSSKMTEHMVLMYIWVQTCPMEWMIQHRYVC